MAAGRSPKVFISYSWDDDNHRKWVRDFATRLRGDGIDAILDRWQVVPGDQLPAFMERAVRESDFVLCVCTPRYKEKSDMRSDGVGYEGDIITGEVFANHNPRKFIPVLRRGKWEHAAPSWLLGKYYIDLCGDPYGEENYADLLRTFFDERESAPPIGNGWRASAADRESPEVESAEIDFSEKHEENFEFVNREIELETLSPEKLLTSYWQCALISAPTGYGKSRLLNRLIERFAGNHELQQNAQEPKHEWSYCSVDIAKCPEEDRPISYIWEKICNRNLPGSYSLDQASKELCSYILDTMSAPLGNGPSRGVLLIFDSIEKLSPADAEWLSTVFHEVITGSYIDYKKDQASFPVRVILSGTNTESFWNTYKKWEESANRTPFLRAPQILNLSPFKKMHVEDLISRRARKRGMTVVQEVISDIADRLLYLSGGHPAIINKVLDELFEMGLRRYDDYLKNNRRGLIRKYVSRVTPKILYRFPALQDQKDIKTICVFRLIGLNVLSKLLSEGLIASQANISLLGSLCENRILKPPSATIPFYHDDIIRRILYLDLAFGSSEDTGHVQKIHQCAKNLYCELVNASREHHTSYYFFVEWLFHVLQIDGFAKDSITQEWKAMLTSIQPTFVSLDDVKHAIKEMLEQDSEVRYLYRERFGSEDFLPLFSS